MDFVLSWLREEREVITRAKIMFALVLLLGLMLGSAFAGFQGSRQIQEAQLALATAQQNRDFWKDKYEAVNSPGATAKPAPKAPTVAKAKAAPSKISWPRTALLIAAIVAAVLAILLFAPLPKRGGVKAKLVSQAEVPTVASAVSPPASLSPPTPTPATALSVPARPSTDPEVIRERVRRQKAEATLIAMPWSQNSSYQLIEAAALWANESPPSLPYSSGLSHAGKGYLSMLKAAVIDGDLEVVKSGASAFQIFTDPDERTRVTRASLIEFAKGKAARPLFLFFGG